MSKINDLHEKAMEFCDEAFFAKRNGDSDAFAKFSRQALEPETEAANLLKDNFEAEPSRSILYRSAASIAIDCKEYRQAEKLISMALVGNPPNEIAEELRDLLEKVHFNRHLELKNVDLTESEMQMTMSGSAVSYGTVLTEAFIDRVKDFERIIYRTVERLLEKTFRERGPTDKSIQDGYSLYMTAPRAGSFAVTLQLGKQMKLPGIDLSSDVFDEVIDCFELINSGKEKELKEKISEDSYYLSFVSLAKRIAPDGEKVSMVGLTKVRGGKEIKLALTKKRKEILLLPETKELQEGVKSKQVVEVQGRLCFADDRNQKRTIQIEESNGLTRIIIVPEGMLDDIVKPLWDEIVVVKGYQEKNKIYLNEIFKLD